MAAELAQIDDEPAGMPVRAVGSACKFCMEQVLDVAHKLACGLPDIASHLPQRKHEWAEWHVSIAQQSRNRGIGRWRSAPSLRRRDEGELTKAAHGKGRTDFRLLGWRDGRVEVPEHHHVS